ncbi:unnamed protein product [Cercopithifilaria johnstoni]|uniref:Uncharacterized protein n=1 Tax=Cercopithifilaria johnstoni TaxID=2874296 RepID=A0A8J2MCC0_9BILA|nr:unnamed protein product [Cercopithifilaria johnstoni]
MLPSNNVRTISLSNSFMHTTSSCELDEEIFDDLICLDEEGESLESSTSENLSEIKQQTRYSRTQSESHVKHRRKHDSIARYRFPNDKQTSSPKHCYYEKSRMTRSDFHGSGRYSGVKRVENTDELATDTSLLEVDSCEGDDTDSSESGRNMCLDQSSRKEENRVSVNHASLASSAALPIYGDDEDWPYLSGDVDEEAVRLAASVDPDVTDEAKHGSKQNPRKKWSIAEKMIDKWDSEQYCNNDGSSHHNDTPDKLDGTWSLHLWKSIYSTTRLDEKTRNYAAAYGYENDKDISARRMKDSLLKTALDYETMERFTCSERIQRAQRTKGELSGSGKYFRDSKRSLRKFPLFTSRIRERRSIVHAHQETSHNVAGSECSRYRCQELMKYHEFSGRHSRMEHISLFMSSQNRRDSVQTRAGPFSLYSNKTYVPYPNPWTKEETTTNLRKKSSRISDAVIKRSYQIKTQSLDNGGNKGKKVSSENSVPRMEYNKANSNIVRKKCAMLSSINSAELPKASERTVLAIEKYAKVEILDGSVQFSKGKIEHEEIPKKKLRWILTSDQFQSGGIEANSVEHKSRSDPEAVARHRVITLTKHYHDTPKGNPIKLRLPNLPVT